LAAVDFHGRHDFDRQYRKAVPTEEALRMMIADSGKHLIRRLPKSGAAVCRTGRKSCQCIPDDASAQSRRNFREPWIAASGWF